MPCQKVLECWKKDLDLVPHFDSTLCGTCRTVSGQIDSRKLTEQNLLDQQTGLCLTYADASCDVDDWAASLKGQLCGIDSILLRILGSSGQRQEEGDNQ